MRKKAVLVTLGGVIAVAAIALGVYSFSDKAADKAEREAQAAALTNDAIALTKDYGTNLQGALKGAMENSGPVGAVEFCGKEAPGIAQQASNRSGWRITRTSLKPRNPKAKPDDFERQVMTDFAASLAGGTPVAALRHAEVVYQNGERVFRYVQAIPTGELCLTCHGSDLKPEVDAKIKELFPDDLATGFKQGELRGAFTLSKKL
ncbi:MAG: DUF3365 domain-containing protein [Methylacidiphilales bacterium]|nr:DUF3365 domain-containing protein [Candidatus Methylacidiphilales bacterium]